MLQRSLLSTPLSSCGLGLLFVVPFFWPLLGLVLLRFSGSCSWFFRLQHEQWSQFLVYLLHLRLGRCFARRVPSPAHKNGTKLLFIDVAEVIEGTSRSAIYSSSSKIVES